MVKKFLLSISLVAAAFSANADTSYSLTVPTLEPYTKIEGGSAPGSFTDTVYFELSSSHSGYIWLFARQGGLTGIFDNILNPSLTVKNLDTNEMWSATSFSSISGGLSHLNPEVLNLTLAGLDPNNSLFLAGTLGAGNYAAEISGTANGLFGGTYIAKFNLAPAIPEPSTLALMAVGLTGLMLRASKRKNLPK